MRILAIENSTPTGSVALVAGGVLEFEEIFTAARGRSAALFGVLRNILKSAAPDRIAVGTGPGSYNGIRVALAAGKGIQMARRAHFVALPSALCLDAKEYVWFGDARGGQFHFSWVAGRQFREGPRLAGPEELRALLETLRCPLFSDAPQAGMPEHAVAFPSAKVLAELAADAPPQEGMAEPLYLKPPHVTVPRSARGCNQAGSE